MISSLGIQTYRVSPNQSLLIISHISQWQLLRHPSRPIRWMQIWPTSQWEVYYHYQFRPYQMVVCEMPQCFNRQNKPDTAQQVPHSKHTLSLITAVTAACSREALCLFVLSRAGEGGGLWNGCSHCTSREAVYTSIAATQKKMHDFLPRRRLMQRLHLLISERLERPQWQIVGFLSLWFLSTVCPDDL